MLALGWCGLRPLPDPAPRLSGDGAPAIAAALSRRGLTPGGRGAGREVVFLRRWQSLDHLPDLRRTCRSACDGARGCRRAPHGLAHGSGPGDARRSCGAGRRGPGPGRRPTDARGGDGLHPPHRRGAIPRPAAPWGSQPGGCRSACERRRPSLTAVPNDGATRAGRRSEPRHLGPTCQYHEVAGGHLHPLATQAENAQDRLHDLDLPCIRWPDPAPEGSRGRRGRRRSPYGRRAGTGRRSPAGRRVRAPDRPSSSITAISASDTRWRRLTTTTACTRAPSAQPGRPASMSRARATLARPRQRASMAARRAGSGSEG